MTTFIDTSALIAMLNRDDAKHADCANAWKLLVADDAGMVTTNYVIVETCALAQRRFGMDSIRSLTTDFMPLLSIDHVDESLHAAGLAAMLTANKRDLSLVDCVSFEVMRRRDVTRALTLDADFLAQGFTVVP